VTQEEKADRLTKAMEAVRRAKSAEALAQWDVVHWQEKYVAAIEKQLCARDALAKAEKEQDAALAAIVEET